jgi:hypothetical protein
MVNPEVKGGNNIVPCDIISVDNPTNFIESNKAWNSFQKQYKKSSCTYLFTLDALVQATVDLGT